MESVENLQQETHKFLFYERSLAKQQQMKLQFIQRRVCLNFEEYLAIMHTQD